MKKWQDDLVKYAFQYPLPLFFCLGTRRTRESGWLEQTSETPWREEGEKKKKKKPSLVSQLK